MKKTVFLCEPIHPTARALLEEHAVIVDELTQADGAINRNLRMDGAWMDRCPKLKVIGIHGTGTDGVDLAEARRRGIRVFNTPGENADSVAELIVTFALLLARNIPACDRGIQNGEVLSVGGALPGRELRGRTFGMIGCGTIALRAGQILRDGFGMELAGWSRSLTPDKAARLGIRYCEDPAAVMEIADVVSVGTSLTPQTVHLVNREALSHAKPGCVLINTARGDIVDQEALYNALTTGILAGAACDVFPQEPPTRENPLVGLPNFLATPHIGANTEEALYRTGMRTVRNLLSALEEKDIDSIHWVV